MAKTRGERLEAALRENLKRRKAAHAGVRTENTGEATEAVEPEGKPD